MKFFRILLLLSLPFYFFSCKTQQRLPYYLDNINDSTGKGEVKFPDLKIQKGDLLSIQINSLSTRPEVDVLYNFPVPPGAVAGSGGGSQSGSTTGYLVDSYGNIEHHRLGVFHAEGLTKYELAAEVKKRLTEPVEILANPTVIIRYLNFHVTVLGQVGKEGPVTVPGERLTILEAVGLAGGITDYGKKNSVRVLREVNGQRETGIIDLSDKNLFESPYYNLMQNDVVLVAPTRQRMNDAEQQRAFQKISMGLTLVAAAATLASIFIKSGN